MRFQSQEIKIMEEYGEETVLGSDEKFSLDVDI